MMKSFKLFHKWRQALWQIPAILIVTGMLALSVNSLRKAPLPLIGDWSVGTQMTTVSGERLDISIVDAAKLFREKAAVFIDARSAAYYEKGHIQGALNLPWQDVDRLFLSITADLLPGTPIVTYCDGEGCNLSHDLAVFLRDMGFENVKVLAGGWTAWKNANLPVDEKNTVSF
ncbi:MAG: rhodanese-like domain-containing protein [Desulfobacterales bacterium]|nr:rhodanese-like domain-containing protein [Desulfobacterales bacterium]